MMYQKGFVLCLKDDKGKVLRETSTKYGKTVYIPYDSHYTLLLKNNNYEPVLIEVEIDGMDVLNGQRLLIKARDSQEIKGFCLDGNLRKKFKFVSKNHPEVQDPESEDLGKVKITIYKFIDYTSISSVPDGYWKPWKFDSQLNESWKIYTRENASFCSSSDSKGATIEGDDIPNFIYKDYFYISTDYEVMELYIKAPNNNQYLTVENSKSIYCICCGKKNPINANFCMNCGEKLVKKF